MQLNVHSLYYHATNEFLKYQDQCQGQILAVPHLPDVDPHARPQSTNITTTIRAFATSPFLHTCQCSSNYLEEGTGSNAQIVDTTVERRISDSPMSCLQKKPFKEAPSMPRTNDSKETQFNIGIGKNVYSERGIYQLAITEC